MPVPLAPIEVAPAHALPDGYAIQRGTPAQAEAMLALITASLEEGHLLPRTLDDLRRHAERFLVIVAGDALVGCAELAPLSGTVAEVRSLVIDAAHRGKRLGPALIESLGATARREQFGTLCAFTHEAAHFVRLGFTIVPHTWLPEKIATDCVACPKFRTCGQYAVALPLRGTQVGSMSAVRTSRRAAQPRTAESSVLVLHR
ncbi:MAG: GNAT family N-acetyltransferase [Acidobacteria bacterium]|nr:GNAT family N-acetyltransferase [Acidobacteriota bacterium]